jgi:uncharacterized membrane protein YidH (DUF202 family)
MDDINYKIKMIYRYRIMAALYPVGLALAYTYHLIFYYYWSSQDVPVYIRTYRGFGRRRIDPKSILCFIIFLILSSTLHMLMNYKQEFTFEVFVFIIGATISMLLTTIEDSYITKRIADEMLRNKYYISLRIWVLVSYIFLVFYWIGMRAFLKEPVKIMSSNRIFTALKFTLRFDLSTFFSHLYYLFILLFM